MSHFAKVLNGKVIQVIVADETFFSTFVDTSPGEWIQTSYNTRGNIHYGQDGKPDGLPPFRGNYAMIGGTWDAVDQVFCDPQPYPSWTLDRQSWIWVPPVPYPADPQDYRWDEATLSWVLITPTGQ